MIEISDITYGYNNTKIFEKFNLSIKKGEFFMILGKNGSGKSTLANLIIGIDLPVEGKIIIDGLDISTDDIWEIRKNLGVIFQNPEDQFVGVTVDEELSFILENYDEDNIDYKIDEVLNLVGLIDKKYEYIEGLSGGQKQKLALASALLLNPKILVLDEASAMLDPRSREELLELLKNLNEDGVTIVYITHYVEEIVYSTRCLLLDKGNKIFEEPSEKLLTRDLLEYNLVVPFHMRLLTKLNQNGKKYSLKNNQSVVDEICRYI
jgi:energy-coupling factor transport system ATP-binding protein